MRSSRAPVADAGDQPGQEQHLGGGAEGTTLMHAMIGVMRVVVIRRSFVVECVGMVNMFLAEPLGSFGVPIRSFPASTS